MVSSSAGVAGLPLSLVSGRQAAAERGGGGEDHRRAERNGPRERQEPNVHRASGRPTGASASERPLDGDQVGDDLDGLGDASWIEEVART